MANFIEQPVDFLNAKKERLLGVLTLPKYITNLPALIICHGFSRNKSERKFVELSRYIANKGIAVLRFDFAGRGESEGDFGKTDISKEASDLALAFNFLSKQKRVNANRIAILGHSLAGLVAILFQRQYQKANTLILLAPALQQNDLVKQWYTPKQIALWQKQGYLDTAKGRLGVKYLREALALDWQEAVAKIKCPVLVLHGKDDEDVPLKYAKSLFNELKAEKQIVVVEQTDHSFESEQAKQTLCKTTTRWLQKYL